MASSSCQSDMQHLEALNTLRSHKRLLQEEEKFVEAAEDVLKIRELQTQQQAAKLQELDLKQREDWTYLQQVQAEELNDFQAKHERTLTEFLDEAQRKETELLHKHRQQLEEYAKSLEDNTPVRFKPSPQLLNLVACKQNANQTEQFSNAHQLKHEIAQLRETEEHQYLKQRTLKIQKQVELFKKKLEKEVDTLTMKKVQALKELEKEKRIQQEVLDKKYLNIKRELEAVQRIERNKASGMHKTGAGLVFPNELSLSYSAKLPQVNKHAAS